jgi:hypothetical protein
MNRDRDKNREVKNITHTRKMNINGGSDIFITLSNPCRNGYKSHGSTQGIQHLNKKHSIDFKHMEGQTLEKLTTKVTTWVCVVTTQQFPT